MRLLLFYHIINNSFLLFSINFPANVFFERIKQLSLGSPARIFARVERDFNTSASVLRASRSGVRRLGGNPSFISRTANKSSSLRISPPLWRPYHAHGSGLSTPVCLVTSRRTSIPRDQRSEFLSLWRSVLELSTIETWPCFSPCIPCSYFNCTSTVCLLL